MRCCMLLATLLVITGCAISDAVKERQEATTRCRDLGYVGAEKDAGAWYCWKDRLDELPRVQPVTPPKEGVVP